MRKGTLPGRGDEEVKTQTSPDVPGAQGPAIRHGDRGAGLLGLSDLTPTTLPT